MDSVATRIRTPTRDRASPARNEISRRLKIVDEQIAQLKRNVTTQDKNLTEGFELLQKNLAKVSDNARSELSSGMEMCMKSTSELFELFERLSEAEAQRPDAEALLRRSDEKWQAKLDDRCRVLEDTVEKQLKAAEEAREQQLKAAEEAREQAQSERDARVEALEQQLKAAEEAREQQLKAAEEAREQAQSERDARVEALEQQLGNAESSWWARIEHRLSAFECAQNRAQGIDVSAIEERFDLNDRRRREEIDELSGLRLRVDALTAEHTRRSKVDSEERRHGEREVEELRAQISSCILETRAAIEAESEARATKMEQVGEGMKLMAKTISETTGMLHQMPQALKEHHQLMGHGGAPQSSQLSPEHASTTAVLTQNVNDIHAVVMSMKAAVSKLAVSNESNTKRSDRLLDRLATLETCSSQQIADLEASVTLHSAELQRLASGTDKLRHAVYRLEAESSKMTPQAPKQAAPPAPKQAAPPAAPPPNPKQAAASTAVPPPMPRPKAAANKIAQPPKDWQQQLDSLQSLRQAVQVNTKTKLSSA